MCSGLGLIHIQRGNTPKHVRKHTKHVRKHTMYHMAKHDKMNKNMTCVEEWAGDVHTRISWAFMGPDGHVGM